MYPLGVFAELNAMAIFSEQNNIYYNFHFIYSIKRRIIYLIFSTKASTYICYSLKMLRAGKKKKTTQSCWYISCHLNSIYMKIRLNQYVYIPFLTLPIHVDYIYALSIGLVCRAFAPLARCLYKVTGLGILFICGIVLRCEGNLKSDLRLDQLQQIWQSLSNIAILTHLSSIVMMLIFHRLI